MLWGMLALTDAALARLAIAATAVPVAARRKWLRRLAMAVDPGRGVVNQRTYRKRYNAGLVSPNVTFAMGAVADMLVRQGFLHPNEREHLTAVKLALEAALEVWPRYR
jgi:hypothetical protein